MSTRRQLSSMLSTTVIDRTCTMGLLTLPDPLAHVFRTWSSGRGPLDEHQYGR